MRFYVQNFGCRATQADGAALAEQLGAQGYSPVSESVQADLVLVNTCTVTASADRDARQYIRRLHRENPARRILVTGCYAQRAPEELAALPGVTWVVDNSCKPKIPALLAQELPLRHNRGAGTAQHDFVSSDSFAGARQPAPFNSEGELTLAEQPAKIITGNIFEQSAVLVAPSFGAGVDRTRPTLKIQDGCNNRCAYCVIPFVRGKSRSLPPDEVIAHLQRLVGEGYQEVVLSGVDMGSYGFDFKPRTDLLELIQRALQETSVPLLRLSSLEPMDLTEEFLALLASTTRIARHIHAPLQSGSNRILRRMRRWYTAEAFAERIERARAVLGNVGIGADVIVGFPGETDDDFRQTYELVDRLPFTYLHVFSYSKRPGTAAVALEGDVSPKVIRERSRALRALAAEKAAHFRARQVGARLRVLTLTSSNSDGTRNALSENYLKLRLRGSDVRANRLVNARIEAVEGNYLFGSV